MLPNDAEQDDDDFKLLEDDHDVLDPARKSAEFFTRHVSIESLTPQDIDSPPRSRFLSGIFSFPWYLGSITVWLYLTIGLTISALLVTCLYHIMLYAPDMGLMMGVPIGTIAMGVLSYASAMYLYVVEQTAEGRDAIDDWPGGGWQEWFWTLPSSFGMLGLAALVGWILGRVVFSNTWIPIVVVSALLYPVLQLCALDSGRVTMPLSRRVLATLITHPIPWGVFYSLTLALFAGYGWLGWLVWSDPPYVTVLLLAPLAATLLLIYGRLLGRLAGSFGAEPK